MSKLASILYSLIVAPRRKYSPARFADEYFRGYAQQSDEKRKTYTDRASEYLRLFHPDDGVLDVGCGVGYLLEGFWSLGSRIAGLEISAEAIALAPDSIRPSIKQGGLPATGFGDKEFDLVLCIDVMEHIPPKLTDEALRELVRITRKHLVLSICLWDERNAREDPTHINLHSRGYWLRKMRKLGLPVMTPKAHHFLGRNSFVVTCEGEPNPISPHLDNLGLSPAI